MDKTKLLRLRNLSSKVYFFLEFGADTEHRSIGFWWKEEILIGGSESGLLVFATAGADWKFPHCATCSPVAQAVLTEMARLVKAVVVIVAELGVLATAARTGDNFLWFL